MAYGMVDGRDLLALGQGSDMTGKLHYLVKADTTDNQVVMAGSGDAVLGVIYEEANSTTTGKPVSVQWRGVAKVLVGAVAVTAGSRLQSDVNGLALTYSGGEALGTALTGGAAGTVISVALDRG
jgi:hypothetical protein